MTAVITTLTFSLEHEPDQQHTRVVGQVEASTPEARADFKQRLGAAWHDDENFELKIQYALTATNLLTEWGLGVPVFRPADARIPLSLIVDRAVGEAQALENWPVQAVEILDADMGHRFEDGIERLVYVANYTVRITQTRTP